VPLFAMWSAQWDQIYPLLLFIGLYFTHTGLQRRSAWRLLAAGVSLSIATFFSVGNFVLMAIVGLYGFAWTTVNHRGAGTRRSLVGYVSLWWRSAIAFGLGCASIWLIYAVMYRVNPLDVISTGSRLAYESTTGSRSYGVWVIRNPIDFAIFFGAPLAILLVAGIAKSLRGARSLTAARHANSSMLLLIVATVVPLAALNISGAVRGEVGRLWMYFGPLLALIACAQIGAHDRWTRAVLIGLMALQLLTLYAHWRVSDSFLDQPPERHVNFLTPQPRLPRRDSFGKTIELVGYDVSRTGRALNLALYWHALVQPAHAYTVFVHVLDETGRLVAQQDNMPVRDQLPTSCWQPGEFVVDPYSIPLPASVQGPLSIEIGLYRLDTAERLGLDDGSGTSVTLTVR